MKHRLEADGIILDYNLKSILSDIYLKCETGEIVGILGKNGEGKSCLMKIIYGSLEPLNKSIRFDNKTYRFPYKNPDLLRFLPQNSFLPKILTLKQVFTDFEMDFDLFKDLFPDSGINSQLRIDQLSKGQIRLIELYLVLKSKSRFIMLDEPFTNIMPLHVDKMKQLITIEKANKGILVTDHLYKHIIDISDKLYILSKGKIHHIEELSEVAILGYAKL